MKSAIIFCACLTLVACGSTSNRVSFTVDSYPTGALITVGKRSFGEAPADLTLPKDLPGMKGDSLPFPVTATWPSGATKDILFDIDINRDNSTYTVVRPSSAPRVEIDIENAKNKVKQVQLDQYQRNISQSDNSAAWEAVGKGMENYGNATKSMANDLINQPANRGPNTYTDCSKSGNTMKCKSSSGW